ncbi:MAG: Blue-light-activated protein [Deltaproteobacteria bacterium ADurb.Bin510]|nr:MAG: Blue-light-activated protein [Deltaproteobacteria bacterium ADurb.Bin510]
MPLVFEEDRPAMLAILSSVKTAASGNNREFRICRKDGSLTWGAISWQPIYDTTMTYLGIRASVRDITDRYLNEEIMRLRLHLLQFAALHGLEELLAETLDCLGRLTGSPLGFFLFVENDQRTLSLQAWSTETSQRACQAEGRGRHYDIAAAGIWCDCVRQRRPVIHNDYLKEPGRRGLPEGHAPISRELTVPIFRNELVVAAVGLGNKACDYDDADIDLVAQVADLVWDIVERKQAEAEREKLQAQLLQAQKLESVGRLAGGVAHDFNNMLMVIIGHAELGLSRLAEGSPLIDEFKQIRNAAQRSSDLTNQLLAFVRQQPVSPRVLDLNATVAGMFKMLSRLIGEDIDLLWRPGPDLWPVEIDPTQVDQILANLVVNARDAIGGNGSVTIETRNMVLDEHYCQQQPGCVAGEYVMLTVSDTGKGMDAETMQHIFEPFFTTKATGKGTGLGLAMVYGAIHQNNGFINVYSEPGLGTTFKIYLPRTSSAVQQEAEVEQVPGAT